MQTFCDACRSFLHIICWISTAWFVTRFLRINSMSIHPKEIPVRPCEWYKEEYKDCRSIKARFHQYFVNGEITDCSQWKEDYQHCAKFRKNRDLKSIEMVINSENKRKEIRDELIKQNDVWEYRSAPPENWNSNLPDWMLKRKENSILMETQNRLNEGVVPEPIFNGFRCTIM